MRILPYVNNLFGCLYLHLHLAHLADRLKKRTKRARKIQSNVLNWLLRLNGNSCFGQDHGLDTINNYEELANRLGITDYETYRPYVQRMANGQFDAVVAMYHDQGMIPVKLLAFEDAVNVTIGIPIIRTSPAHGTAFDITGKNIANPAGMKAAIMTAIQMHVTKKAHQFAQTKVESDAD